MIIGWSLLKKQYLNHMGYRRKMFRYHIIYLIALSLENNCLASAAIQWDNAEENEMKWNESGFRPPLCTYRLNWARRTSWGWWDDRDDTVLQTQDSKFEPWRSEAEHATSRSRRLPTILTFTRGWGRNNFVSFKPPRQGNEPRTLAWKAAVLTTTLGPPPTMLKTRLFRRLPAAWACNSGHQRNTLCLWGYTIPCCFQMTY